MASTCATCTASIPGRRNVDEVTKVPRRIRSVSRAIPPRVTHASVGPGSPSPPMVKKWSERKKASKPAASAALATVTSWS